MSVNPKISLMSLYEAGAHRGSHKSRINPKLKTKIHKVDNNSLCVIDLVQTIETLEKAAELIFSAGKKKKQILIVGTSKYIASFAKEFAEMFSQPMPYVNYRWLGGQLTNWGTVKKTLKEIDKLEAIINNTEFYNKLSRNEQLSKSREYTKKMNLFAGIRNLKSNKPGVVIVLDPKKNKTAILEAETNKVPVICLTNLNTVLLPQDLTTTVTFNNTSLNAVRLIATELLDNYNQGVAAGSIVAVEEGKETTTKIETKEKVN
jgi:small subunit ribosomal protein S2